MTRSYTENQALLQRYVRENFGIHINVFFEEEGTFANSYSYRIVQKGKSTKGGYSHDYKSYEDALEQALFVVVG